MSKIHFETRVLDQSRSTTKITDKKNDAIINLATNKLVLKTINQHSRARAHIFRHFVNIKFIFLCCSIKFAHFFFLRGVFYIYR